MGGGEEGRDDGGEGGGDAQKAAGDVEDRVEKDEGEVQTKINELVAEAKTEVAEDEASMKEAKRSAKGSTPSRKGSGRKGFQTLALDLSADASTAVLNRLPPQGPPTDVESFDQERWLEDRWDVLRMKFREGS